jgi:hypothetical protein
MFPPIATACVATAALVHVIHDVNDRRRRAKREREPVRRRFSASATTNA